MRFPEAFDGSFGQLHFSDAPVEPRRARRMVRVADQFLAHPQGTLPQKISDPHQLDAAYRLFKADEVTHTATLATHFRLTQARMAQHPGDVILIPHDDVLLDYSHLGDDVELGPIGNGKGKGFVCHNSLALTPGREVLGLAHQILYCHPPRGTKRQRPGPAGRLWRDAIEAIPAPPPGKLYVHLADRAGDITEVLDYADEHGLSHVIRSQHDRSCEVDEQITKLHESAQTWQPMGVPRQIEVASQKGRPARAAAVRIAWRVVTLQPPANSRGRERGVPLVVWAVRVWEPEPPEGVEAIDWLLLSNVEVQTVEDAWQRVEWYACRMVVEDLHKGMKTGVSIEELQLTTRERLEAAIGVLSVVAVVLLAVRDAGRNEGTARQSASLWVPPLWIEVLSLWRHKQARPDWTLGEFLWALGRLGGHQNRPSDGAPGWLTLWRGWVKLQSMLQGAALASSKRSGGT
jgi:Transposase DNA-binding